MKFVFISIAFTTLACAGAPKTTPDIEPITKAAQAFLKTVCTGPIHTKNGQQGCTTSDGGRLTVQAGVVGQLVSVGTQEACLSIWDSRVPHVAGFGYGMLLRKTDRWQSVGRVEGVTAATRWPLRLAKASNGRDQFLMESNAVFSGYSKSSLSVITFEGTGEMSMKSKELLVACDNAGACPKSLVKVSYDPPMLRDVNGDGQPDIEVTLTQSLGAMPKSCEAKPTGLKKKMETLTFLHTATGYTPASKGPNLTAVCE